MKKSNADTKTHAQGAIHDMTTQETKKSTPRPTDFAIHGPTPIDIHVSRAVDQELEWYFSYAEAALRRDRVGMLPSYAALLMSDPTDAAVRIRAGEIARIVRGCLLAMRPPHAEVLRAVYTPRVWPARVVRAFDCLAPVAVRLAFAESPWPSRSSRLGLEQAAALHLAAALASSDVSVAKLRSRSQRFLGSAIVAYAGMRALKVSAPGVG